jgi:DNA-binding PadR family transcriptional regulator
MRSNLELFVLALAQRGFATPYDLRVKAGLSLGSTVPVLSRLEKEGLLKASDVGARRSRKFSITAKRAKVLAHEWPHQLGIRSTDVDTVVRTATLSWLNNAPAEACRYLETTAAGLQGWGRSLRAEAERFAGTMGSMPDADAFRWLRTYCEAARAEATANALVDRPFFVA